MAGVKSNREVEIKLRLPDAAAGDRLLRGAGFRVRRPRVFEQNTLYDTLGGRLRRQGSLLRIRQAGGTALLTYKGPGVPSKYKSREELELTVSDGALLGQILGRLGMTPSFRYEKYRTEYERDEGGGIATVDETPIGDFIELEGEGTWIDATAGQLGFSEQDYITASYAQLFFEARARGETLLSEMKFEEQTAQ